jgi:hypothetical protein
MRQQGARASILTKEVRPALILPLLGPLRPTPVSIFQRGNLWIFKSGTDSDATGHFQACIDGQTQILRHTKCGWPAPPIGLVTLGPLRPPRMYVYRANCSRAVTLSSTHVGLMDVTGRTRKRSSGLQRG